MSLVAYESSDESGDESSEVQQVQNNVGSVLSRPTPRPRPTSNAYQGVGLESIVEDGVCSPSNGRIQSLFQSLPKPKQNMCESTNEELEQHADAPGLGLLAFLPEAQSNSNLGLGLGQGLLTSRPATASGNGKDFTKKTGPVKITLPSLSQFNDEMEDEPVKKKLKPSQKGSGLFAILPAPKNIKPRQNQQPLVPYVFTKKLTPTPEKSKHLQKSLITVKPNKPPSPETVGNDSEDEDKDFFSLNSVHNLPKETSATDSSEIDMKTHRFSPIREVETDAITGVHSFSEEPLAFHTDFLPSPWTSESPLPGPSRENHRPMPGPTNCQDISSQQEEEWTLPESSSSFPQENLQLDAEAMQRLCGRRSKKHEPVQFIDVSGKEIMPDPKDWLVKQLSEEQPKMRSHSHKRNDGPTTQQRRKHQITYLAFQAKENELELKNQWSQNRMSRKQTQSKYGF